MKLDRLFKCIAYAVASAFLLSGCILNSEKWYDYGNGKINLRNINFLKPVLEATLTLEQDPIDEIGGQFSEALTDSNVEKYKGFLSKEKIEKSSFYAVKVQTYIMFDAFRLDLYKSPTYIKRPNSYSVNEFLLKKMKDQGVPQNLFDNVKANGKDKVFDRNGFSNFLEANNFNIENYWVKTVAVNAGLGEKGFKFVEKFGIEDRNGESELTESDLSQIRGQLDYSIKSYKNIPAN